MSGVLGRDGVKSVHVELSPALLVRLGRDLLVCRQHRAVRQTDGPGDGGRDIHSIAPDRRPHLTQCKHHDDPKTACGSSELAELPMALVKFGIPQGLFITDARISPQAKREFLSDYPKLALEFLDREELVAEILASAVLRALWFDGGKLGLVNARTIFPFLIRRHEGDRPLLPLRHAVLRERVFAAVREEARTRGLDAELREGTSERGPFERYRLPRRLTNEEGLTADVVATEIGFKGGVALHELQALSEALALKLAEVASTEFGAVTVVVGRAFITPLEGDRAGLRTLTRATRTAAVAADANVVLERNWFLPNETGGWDGVCDARVTEAEWVRLYHRQIDAAVAYEIATPAAPIDMLMRQIIRIGWNKSVFALLPPWETWDHVEVPEPEERIEWRFEPGRVLCGWLHPLSGGTVVRIPRDEGDEAPPFPALDEHAADQAMVALRDHVLGLDGVELVTPERARHMLGVLSADPILADDVPAMFRTADVLAAFDGIASPIDPLARRGELTVAWRAQENDEHLIKAEGETLSKLLNGAVALHREADFLVMTIHVPQLPIRASTPEWLAGVAREVDAACSRINTRESPPTRATAEYWAEAHGVRLGVDWHQSDKAYLWSAGPEGLTPIKVRRDDIERKE